MKKYLITGLAAVAISGMFTSCTHETDAGAGGTNLGVVETYEQAFISRFGTPSADADWGFGNGATKAGTRAVSDYTNYKGTMTPVVWGQDKTDWQWKWLPYTFPSAPEIPTTKPNDAEYYEGGYKYFSGGTIFMDENTSKHVEVQGYCDMYVVKSGTGEGNVTIESTTKWYVGNVTNGQKIRVFVCPGVTLKIPANDEGNLQANVEYYFAPGSNLICNLLKLNGTAFYMGSSTTTTASTLQVNNNGIFYNIGTANISGDVSVENGNSIIVNDGTMNAANLLTKGSGRVQNNAELTISNTTTINSNSNVWVNNGHYKTKYFTYTATSSSVINNCFLEVEEDFSMNISDGSGDFKIDSNGGVLTKNFYGGGTNGGPFKITMGSNSVFKVTNEAHMNALASAIASAHYGFNGIGTGYAVLQAKKIVKDKDGEGNVAYSGKLYVSAEEHFAQGYSGSYPFIHYYDGCSEENIYASGFKSGKPDITIQKTPCNPGFGDTPGGGDEPGGGDDDTTPSIRVIAEDMGDQSLNENSDFDFNDVVFDVTWVSNSEVDVEILAAGGTLPLTVGWDGVDESKYRDFEVHNLLGYSETMIINTHSSVGNHIDGVPSKHLTLNGTFSKDDFAADVNTQIPIKVKKNGVWYDIKAEKKKAAAKLAVDKEYEPWCNERKDIDFWWMNADQQGLFSKYTQDPTTLTKFWYKQATHRYGELISK